MWAAPERRSDLLLYSVAMGSRRRARVFVLAGLMAATLGLAGCAAESPEPASTGVATARPTASPSFDPGPFPLPTVSPEMANDDQAGAEAFVLYVVGLLNHGYTNADSEPFARVSDPGCVACTKSMDDINGLNSRGDRQVGGRLTLSELQTDGPRTSGDYVVTAKVSQERTEYWSAEGEVLDSRGQESGRIDFVVAYRDARWLLLEMGSNS